MDSSVILETTFLIDLERELIRKIKGPAHRFLRGNPLFRLHVTFTVAGEFAAGPAIRERKHWESFLTQFQILLPSKDICWEYGKIYRYLKDNGMLIGANDLWIGATALVFGMPVVTRNMKHFRRIPGLQVTPYAGEKYQP